MTEQPPDTGTIAAWYNRRYASGQEQAFGRPPQESVQRLHYLPPVKGLRVLDVACGQGYFLRAVQEAGGHPYGVDIAIEACRIAREQSSAAQIGVASGQQLPFPDDYFDALTCWGSLEHHPDMVQALAEFTRVTRPGGQLVLRVPNRRFWVYLLQGALTGHRVGTEQQDILEHLLSLEEWRALFCEAGLTVETVQADNWFLQHPLSSVPGIVGKLKLLARRLALIVASLPYTYVFDFVCCNNRD